MHEGRARTLAVTIIATIALLLAGCDPVDEPGDDPPGSAATTTAPSTESGCSAARGKAGAMLPAATAKFRTVSTNPCVPLADLADQVLQFIPEADPEEPRIRKATFRTILTDTSGRVFAANDVASCAYETDRLAFRIYQQKDHAWSVGAVVVIRGTIDAAVEVAVCYFEKGLGVRNEPGHRTTPGPHWQPCADVVQPTHNGEVYTVLYAATSDEMCGFVK